MSKSRKTNSSVSFSKEEIKEKLREILLKMNSEYSLSRFCEYIENITGGKFSFLTFREILDKIYPDIQQGDKIYLLKYTSLSSLGISENFLLVSLFKLFSFFEKIIDKRILSPSFIYYKVVDIIEKKFNLSTLELIYKFNLTLETEVTVNDFYTSFSQKLLLDEISSIILFKGIDYKKKGKIRIEDLVLVIDSFRDNSLEENKIDDDAIKKAQILKIFMDKNLITVDQLFEGAHLNYLKYDDLKSRIMKEIKLSQKNFNEEEPINESTVDNVLLHLNKNDKIFKDSFEQYLPSEKKKKEEENNTIFLNDIQKYWINEYLDMLSSISITPKMAFEAVSHVNQKNIINLEDLKRQLKIILPNGRITTEEANSIMDSFDLNKTRQLEINQYENIINQVLNDGNENKVKTNNDFNNNNRNIMNIWARGDKSTNYHLLPVKGNFKILDNLRKDLEKNLILYDNKENEINANNINFKADNINEGDNTFIEEYDPISKKNIKKYTNESDGLNKSKNKFKNDSFPIEEYEDEFYLIEALENFSAEKNYFATFELFNYLTIKNHFPRERMSQFVKLLDNDLDGFISLLEIMSFLLNYFKYRSTKLLLKYLYIQIYNEFKMDSCDDFFIKNNIDIYKEVYVNNLCKLLNNLNVEFPISTKLYDEMTTIFPSPIIYKNLCELIDEYKDQDKFNKKSLFKNGSHEVDMKYLEDCIKRIIYGIIDEDEFINTDYLKAKNFRDNLRSILDKCNNVMNLEQYNLNFVKALNIEPEISLTIFQLLKNISPEGEQLISKSDLISFLESYITDNDNINLIDDSLLNEKITTSEILQNLENNSASIKYAFEKIPFSRNGVLTINEIRNTLTQFYNGILPKKHLMQILADLDDNKNGMISYLQLEMFLYEYSGSNYSNKFSSILEIEFIASNILKQHYKNADDYFSEPRYQNIIKNQFNISKEEHDNILINISSSNNNRNELFELLCKKEGKKSGYSLNTLKDWINGYIIESGDYEEIKENNIEDENEEEGESFGMLPDKKLIENAMRKINVGTKGKISLNEFFMKFPSENRPSLIRTIDKEKIGFMSFPDFINRLREIYGIDVNLNYKLCAQYLYLVFIKSPEKVESYILSKSECNSNNIDSYMTHDQIYSNFMFAFANDKFLFENFYCIFREKKGKWANMINLSQFVKFLQMNNLELQGINLFNKNKNDEEDENEDHEEKEKEEEEEEEKENDDGSKDIRMILTKKIITVKDILDKINPKTGEIKNNFTVKESYLKPLLGVRFGLNEDDIQKFINYFKMNEERIDIKKMYNFDPSINRDRDIFLSSEVILKIKEQITHSPFKSYKVYKKKIFEKNKLDLSEVSLLFQHIYNITLFGSLLCMNNEMYLNIDKFFKDNQLTEMFPEKEFDHSLKLALTRLSDYFQKHKDKLKLFKLYDSNQDGYLSPNEFITALNSLKDLNLNDAQKYQILNIADKNKDGKIIASEFLSFVKNIKNNENNDNSELNKKSQKKNELPQIKSMSNSSSKVQLTKRSDENNNNKQINSKLPKRRNKKS